MKRVTIALVACLSIPLVGALVAPSVTATTPPSPPSSPPSAEEDFALPTDWVWLVDDTTTITVAVPNGWTDVDTAAAANDDGSIRPSISAATDLALYRETFDAPGIQFSSLAFDADPQAVLDRSARARDCLASDVQPYDDGAYVGLHRSWTQCGVTGAPEWHEIVASPTDQSRTLLLRIQITLPTERPIVDSILDSFNVTPAAGSGTPATLPTGATTMPPATSAAFDSRASRSTAGPDTTAAATTSDAASGPMEADEITDPVGEIPADAVRIVDDSGTISVKVPSDWTDVTTEPGSNNDGSPRPLITAAPDIDGFIQGFDVPGMSYAAFPFSADTEGLIGELDTYSDSICRTNGAVPYNDGAFVGHILTLTDCDGTGTRIVMIAANPPNNAFTAFVLVQLVEADDLPYTIVQGSFNIASSEGGEPSSDSATTTSGAGLLGRDRETPFVDTGPPSTPPPNESDAGSAFALEQFIAFGEESGYTLVDPVCAASSTDGPDLTYTCYAITSLGEPFIATTSMSGDGVAEFDIIAEPGQSSAPPSTDEALDEDPAPFDALRYFDALFSGDPDEIATLQPMTAPGSPAEAYAVFQIEFVQTRLENGSGSATPSYVYLTPEGVLICVDVESCVLATELDVVDGQLVSFLVDGNDIATRLGRPAAPVSIGSATAQVRAAYQPVTDEQLTVFVELFATEQARFELSTAVYVDAEGNQTPIDREFSIAAGDVTVKGTASAGLVFPGVAPGGEVRFLVFPSDGSAPLAAVLPVEPFAAPSDG